jgi:hypothetical protein
VNIDWGCLRTGWWWFIDGSFNNDRDGSVGMAKGYGLDDRSPIPTGGGGYFFFSIASRLTLWSNLSLIQWVLGGVSSGIKRPGRESDYSPPSSDAVNNGGAVSPLPHTFSWHFVPLIKHSDNLNSILLFSELNLLSTVVILRFSRGPLFCSTELSSIAILSVKQR